MELFSFDESDISSIAHTKEEDLKKLFNENQLSGKYNFKKNYSISLDLCDFPKRLKKYDEKIKYYSNEREKLKKILSSINRDFSVNNIKTNIIQTSYIDSLEKCKQKSPIKIKELEEKLNIVVEKYNDLSMKYEIKFNDLENLKSSHKRIREKYYLIKNNYETLVKINHELKEKVIEFEKNNILQQEEYKNLIKKNSYLIKKLEVFGI